MFTVDDDMRFSDYIFVLSELKRVVEDIRNEYSIYYYSTEYNQLRQSESEIISKKIPLRVMEIDNK